MLLVLNFIVESLLCVLLRDLVVLSGLWRALCFQDRNACCAPSHLVHGCCGTNSSEALGGKGTVRVWKEDTQVRDLFSCSSLSEGGRVNLRTTVQFSHLCTDT